MSATYLSIIPKLPSKDLDATRKFYTEKLNFRHNGPSYPDYLILHRDGVEIHFFLFKELDVLENYGMCYLRIKNIDQLYNEIKHHFPKLKAPEVKPWGQKEMYLIDTDHNGLSFGESA